MNLGANLETRLRDILKNMNDASRTDAIDFISEDVDYYLRQGFKETNLEKRIFCFRALFTDMMVRNKTLWDNMFGIPEERAKVIVIFILECYKREIRNKMASFIADLNYPIPLVYARDGEENFAVNEIDILDQILKRRQDKKSICIVSTMKVQQVFSLLIKLFPNCKETLKYKETTVFHKYAIDFYSNIEEYYVVHIRGLSSAPKYRAEVLKFLNKAGLNVFVTSDKDFVFDGSHMFSEELSFLIDPFRNNSLKNPNFKFCIISEAVQGEIPAYSKMKRAATYLNSMYPTAFKGIKSYGSEEFGIDFDSSIFLKSLSDVLSFSDFSSQHFSDSALLKQLRNSISLRRMVKNDDYSPGKQSLLDLPKSSLINDDILRDESLSRLKSLLKDNEKYHIISIFSAQPDPKSLFLHNLFGITYPVEDLDINLSASFVKLRHEDKIFNLIVLDPWRLIAENDKAKDMRRQLMAFGLNVSHITLVHKNPENIKIGDEIEEALLCNQLNVIINSQVYLLDFKLKSKADSILLSNEPPQKDFWQKYIDGIKKWSEDSFDKIKILQIEQVEKDEILLIRSELVKLLGNINTDMSFKDFLDACDGSWQDVSSKKDKLKQSKENIIQAYEAKAKEEFSRKLRVYKSNATKPSNRDDEFYAKIFGEAIDFVGSKFPNRRPDFGDLEREFRKSMFEHYASQKYEFLANTKQKVIEDLKNDMKISLLNKKSFDSKKMVQKLKDFVLQIESAYIERVEEIIKYVRFTFEEEIEKKKYKVKLNPFNSKNVPKVKPEWIKDFSCDCDPEDVTSFIKRFCDSFKKTPAEILNEAHIIYVDSFFIRDKLLNDLKKSSEIPANLETTLRRSVVTEMVVTKLYNFEITQSLEKCIVLKEDEEVYKDMGLKVYDLSFCKLNGNNIYDYLRHYKTYLVETWQNYLCKKISENAKEVDDKIDRLRQAFKTITSKEFSLEDLKNHYKKYNLDPKVFDDPEFKDKMKDKNFKLEKESFDAKIDETFVRSPSESMKIIKDLMKKQKFQDEISASICFQHCNFCNQYCFLKKGHSSDHYTYHLIYEPGETIDEDIKYNDCIHLPILENWDKAGNTEANIKQQKEGFVKLSETEKEFLNE